MIRHYESGRVALQINNFITTESVRLGLHPLGVEILTTFGNLDIKVFLHPNMKDMDFKANIEQLKQKCQEITEAYKEFQVEISFFSTKI